MILSVSNPIKVLNFTGDYHEYEITGEDSLGEIYCKRRYKNFFIFHEALMKKFPGLYIPPIPQKHFEHKNDEVISERQYFLDQFLKECCSLVYLA